MKFIPDWTRRGGPESVSEVPTRWVRIAATTNRENASAEQGKLLRQGVKARTPMEESDLLISPAVELTQAANNVLQP